MNYNFSKLSELLLDVSRSKYSLSICWHISTKFLCDLTMLANLVSGSRVVKILKRWPKTNASNSVGLKNNKKLNLFIYSIWLMSGSYHTRSVLIGVEYRNVAELWMFIYFLLFCLRKLNQN